MTTEEFHGHLMAALHGPNGVGNVDKAYRELGATCEALAQGYGRKVCEIRGEAWSPEWESAFVEKLRGFNSPGEHRL